LDTNRLKSLPLFEGVSDEELEKIAPFLSEVSVSEGKVLVQEGDYAYEFMAIEEGEAEVRRGEQVLAVLGAGDFFGEMGLIDSDRRNATVIAKTGLRLITLDQWDMRRLEKLIPSAAAKIRETVEQRRGT
jgi:CRP/FNR family cyclic AMP-dependent transcriptional regulator